MTLAAIDWTAIIETVVLTVPAVIAAVYAGRIHTAIKTPSGNRLGAVVELTHDLSAVDVALTKAVHKKLTNGEPEPPLPRPLGAHTRKSDKP